MATFRPVLLSRTLWYSALLLGFHSFCTHPDTFAPTLLSLGFPRRADRSPLDPSLSIEDTWRSVGGALAALLFDVTVL